MGFDNSRFTFNPWNDYFGVVMQQGRVQLDSDWNEWLAEFVRRIHAGTLDILGLAGVPSTTPYGFKINAYHDTAGNHLTIGTGRMYVDGILVENHGPVTLAQWNPALAEWSTTSPGAAEIDIDYTDQPYLPGATIPGNGPFLVYLDVWQREVSYLEDVSLVDKAVGVETTGRLQTVWQVKLLDISGVGGVDCSTPDSQIQSVITGGTLIQPSASLLTTGVVPSASAGPCALSPVPGYTGVENQLYRLEIHQGGSTTSTPPPTFKWSREDASVATLVTAISTVTNSAGVPASQLTVQSLGRDQVLGFNPGDWIEIVDDYLELNPPASNGQAQPGELHRIDSINAAANTVTLDFTVSSASFPVINTNQTIPSRHTRIRRWDQAGAVYQSDGATVWIDLDSFGSTGIPVPPADTAVILENGITVAFEGSSFRTGDFWLFAARTADGSVEILNQPAAAQTQPAASPWNAATAYAPGQVVTRSGTYYICLVANTGNAPPNAAFWAPQTSPFGIHHHYRRLGIVDFTATPPKVSDCRRVFQPLANPGIHVTSILLGSSPLLNDSTVTVQALANGISVVFDTAVDPAIITQPTASNCPICFVAADLPVPAASGGGFNRFILSASVTVASGAINWKPAPAAITALVNQIAAGSPPLLARLTLKGNSIWAHGDRNVYLNGSALGVLNTTGGSPQSNLQLPSGDGRRSADFETWFWLISQPPVTLSASTVSFINPQMVGSPVAAAPITLTNNSGSPLTFPGTGISITGANSGDFKVTNTCGPTVAPGASCTLTVTFTPTATGTRTAQLSVMVSAQPTPLLVTLTGTGIQPLVNVSTNNLSFPAQTVGTTSAPQPVILSNPGTSQLTISSLAVEGADYTLTSTCGGNLQPGQQCTINVQFAPTAAGTRTGDVQILTNAGNVLIQLTGTAIAAVPGASVSSTSLDFGVVLTTSSSSKTVTLTSTGNTQLTITGIGITGSNAGSFSQSNTCGGALQPSQQCTITVTFAPAVTGPLSAQLQITTNAGTFTVALTGTGRPPKSETKDTKDGKDRKDNKEDQDKHGHIEKIQLEKIQVGTERPLAQRFSSPPETSGEAEAGGESAMKSAFISPEERPKVGPQG